MASNRKYGRGKRSPSAKNQRARTQANKEKNYKKHGAAQLINYKIKPQERSTEKWNDPAHEATNDRLNFKDKAFFTVVKHGSVLDVSRDLREVRQLAFQRNAQIFHTKNQESRLVA